MERFQGKYRIKSAHLENWDYSLDGAYFVTICTRNRQNYFGEIVDGKLTQTKQSEICMECWLDLPNHYPNCILDVFIIMPNHVHGIIIIDNNMGDVVETGLKPVSTMTMAMTTTTTIASANRVNKRYSLFEIIRGFKTFTARKINDYQKTHGVPFWQSRFYDHIIRNENELNRIREYIRNNPIQWYCDRNNTENIFM